ncbi:hypothetical protein BKA62DRAFT_712381 [Auriculariales sp. MPI-PUGE-AT-0066]|nr:hypothetical protein BKA62DRAFT_712381 [Auriculariales sp. MPI-PUGE-AT-0066]
MSLRLSNGFAALPLELTLTIASLLAFPEVFRLSQVCASWRKAILATPALWTRLHLERVGTFSCNYTELPPLLQRSEQRKLDVTIIDHSPLQHVFHPQAVTKCLVDQLHRIRSLTLVSYGVGISAENLTKPAPLLEQCTLSSRRIRYYLQRVPDNLFGGVAPVLTRLTLRGFGLPSRKVSFPSVQQLIMTEAPNLDGDPYAEYNIRRISRRFPNLRRLVIGQDVPTITEPMPQDDGLAELFVYEIPRILSFIDVHIDYTEVPHLRLCPREALDARILTRLAEDLPPLHTAHFYKRALEGRTLDGRVINLRFNEPTKRHLLNLGELIHHWTDDIEVLKVDSGVFSEFSIVSQGWIGMPKLVSLDVEFTDPVWDNLLFLFGFDHGRHDDDPPSGPTINLPVLARLKLTFRRDEHGEGCRTLAWCGLRYFVRHRLDVGAPQLDQIELVNIVPVDVDDDVFDGEATESRWTSGLAADFVVDGQSINSTEQLRHLAMEALEDESPALVYAEVNEDEEGDAEIRSHPKPSIRRSSARPISPTQRDRFSELKHSSEYSEESSQVSRSASSPVTSRASSPDVDVETTERWELASTYPATPLLELIE